MTNAELIGLLSEAQKAIKEAMAKLMSLKVGSPKRWDDLLKRIEKAIKENER